MVEEQKFNFKIYDKEKFLEMARSWRDCTLCRNYSYATEFEVEDYCCMKKHFHFIEYHNPQGPEKTVGKLDWFACDGKDFRFNSKKEFFIPSIDNKSQVEGAGWWRVTWHPEVRAPHSDWIDGDSICEYLGNNPEGKPLFGFYLGSESRFMPIDRIGQPLTMCYDHYPRRYYDKDS